VDDSLNALLKYVHFTRDALSRLTSRAQAQPPSGSLNGIMTNQFHKSIATGRCSGCCLQRFVRRHHFGCVHPHLGQIPIPGEIGSSQLTHRGPRCDSGCASLGGGRSPHEMMLPTKPITKPHQPTVVLTTFIQLNTIRTVPAAHNHQAI
jgi:hypothetical protein